LLSLHSYLIYCGLYAIAIAIPGPGVVAIIARALQSGFRATIPAAIGTAVGDWALMSLSALGLSVLAESMGRLFMIVKIAGAAYLFYLGYKYWIAKIDDQPSGVVPNTARQGFLSQLSLTLGNPKAIAFFVALLPSVVDLNHLSFVGYWQLSLDVRADTRHYACICRFGSSSSHLVNKSACAKGNQQDGRSCNGGCRDWSCRKLTANRIVTYPMPPVVSGSYNGAAVRLCI